MKKLRFNKQTEQKFSDKLDEKTLRSYKSWYEKLYEFGDYNNLRTLSFDTILDFYNYLLNVKKYSPSSLRVANAALRFLYLELYKKKYRFDKIKLPRTEKKIPISISKKDIKNLFDSILNIKHKSILVLMYATGLDISEVINVKVKDLKNEKLYVRNNNGNIVRNTNLGKSTLDLLRDYSKYMTKNQIYL